MSTRPPSSNARLLDGGARLHLQHGPSDLLIGAETDDPQTRIRAFEAARARFDPLLGELVRELTLLRTDARDAPNLPIGAVARRMARAVLPFADAHFITPMAAVAGAVADEVLAAMRAAAPLRRAYVNNGGDIALCLGEGEGPFDIRVADLSGRGLASLRVHGRDDIGGIATSGLGGRSLSMGIAESVTVIAASAAQADAAATLIANAVDLPHHPRIIRRPASELHPDSDLGARLVVTSVPRLSADEAATALALGAERAERYLRLGHIRGAVLHLQGQYRCVGETEVTDVAA